MERKRSSRREGLIVGTSDCSRGSRQTFRPLLVPFLTFVIFCSAYIRQFNCSAVDNGDPNCLAVKVIPP